MCLVLLVQGAVTLPGAWAGEPAAKDHIVLQKPPGRVVDGDTFEADLDGNGKLELPRERVRLLFVDTPELGESHKGKDRRHGLPAKAFLAEGLKRAPIELLLPRGKKTGKYGRTLAEVWVPAQFAKEGNGNSASTEAASKTFGRINLNMALIRAGHSPLDTRFQFPADLPGYVRAEAEAFDAKRGIWKEKATRRKYLNRLRKEGRTPAGKTNPHFVPDVLPADDFQPARHLNRFVTLRGTLVSRKTLSKGVELLLLRRAQGRPFPAVIFARRANTLPLHQWSNGAVLQLDGFIKRYKGKLELVVHHAARVAVR